jgi:protein CpxP
MKGFIAAVSMMVLLASSVVYAQEKKPEAEGVKSCHGMHHGMGIIKMAEELKLTPEQKKLVAQALKDNREQVKPLREAMKKAFEGLHEVMDKTPGDEAAVRQAAKEVAKAGEELAVNRGKLKAKIDSILTPEQKTKRDEMKAKRMAEFKAHFKEHMEKHKKAMDEWIEKNLK